MRKRSTASKRLGNDSADQLVSTADSFLAKMVYEISHAPVWRHGNNAIVITFDEGDDNAGCCGTCSARCATCRSQ